MAEVQRASKTHSSRPGCSGFAVESPKDLFVDVDNTVASIRNRLFSWLRHHDTIEGFSNNKAGMIPEGQERDFFVSFREQKNQKGGRVEASRYASQSDSLADGPRP